MADDDVTPTVEDVIPEAVEAEIRQYVIPRGPNGAIGWGATPQTITAAVVAAIRGMSPETLAELRPDLTVERATLPQWFDTGKPDVTHLVTGEGGSVHDVRLVPSARVVGPWQVTP